MNLQCASHLHLSVVIPAMWLIFSCLAHADEAFEIEAKELLPAHTYQYDGEEFSAYLSCEANHLAADELITLDVGVECLSSGTYLPLGNPFLERDLPTCLVVCIYDSEGKFVGSIPEFDTPDTERARLERLSMTLQTDLRANEVVGASVYLSTGPVSACDGNRLTLFLQKPGTYTLQAVCAKRMFDIPQQGSLSANQRFERMLKQRTQKQFVGEACRSAPITVVVAGEAEKTRPTKPSSTDPESPTACRLEHAGSTNDGEALVILRHTNTSHADLYLHEPVMRLTRDIMSPVRMWMRNTEGELLVDLSYARAAWQYSGSHPIVRLPPGAFIAKKHKVPKTWNHLGRTLQAGYSEDFFMTKAYAEYRRDGGRTPQGVSSEDYYKLLLKDRLRYPVKSNLLELPAVNPDRDGFH
ncbi:MAG: hypothetical protein WCJ09_17155 [Planctomycetota bacterium]